MSFLRLTIIILLAAAAVLLFSRDRPAPESPPAAADADRPRRGALVDEIIFTQEGDLGKAIELIERGHHHAYASGISSAALYRRVRASTRVEHDYARGTSAELTVNPAGPRFNDGTLNPFHRPAMREALNWLVDRRYIVEEIYGGLATPRVLPLSTAFPDYARLADTARALELRYAHDPDRAHAVIEREMTALGARRENGRWFLEGAPVRLRLLIRTETERRRTGDYLAGLLEEAGFEIERLYRAADEASRIWIAGQPAEGRWHIYTGGWVAVVIHRDQASNFDFYYTPRGRPEPLWQAYDPDPEFDAVAERLQRRDYRDWPERQALMKRALELAMRDSARIWLLDETSFTPRAHNISLATDLAGGFSGSALWPYTLGFTDRTGGRLVCGIPGLLTEPWNPIDGTNWIFDRMIMRALDDPAVLPDPFTGLYLPQRVVSAQVTLQEDLATLRTHPWVSVETAASIPVPADAWIDWDAARERPVTVGERYPRGVSARARVTVRYEDGYLERTWHDGTRVSPADMIIGWLLSFARAKPESPLFDRAHTAPFESFQRHYRGWRIRGFAPLEIEIYSDQVFPDAEWIAATRIPSATPWHTMALAIMAERDGQLAFSSNKADELEIEWLNFVAGPSLEILQRCLEQARQTDFLPFRPVLEEYLRPGEIAERYQALAGWFAARRHFWVGDGPFYLHAVHPVERNVVLRRFEHFPDPADKWLRFSRPPTPALDLDGPMVVEAGRPTGFTLGVFLDSRPYPAADLEEISFLVFDREGRRLADGRAAPDGDRPGYWKIALDEATMRRLGTGAHVLEVAVTSKRVALPAFATHAFAAVPGDD